MTVLSDFAGAIGRLRTAFLGAARLDRAEPEGRSRGESTVL